MIVHWTYWILDFKQLLLLLLLHTVNNTVAKGFNQMAPLREQSL